MTSFWAGEKVRLRAIEPDDWDGLMRLAEEEEWLGDILSPPRSNERFRSTANDHAAGAADGDTFALAVEAVDTGRMVGSISSHHADPRHGHFEYGITIGAEHRRHGYAAEAAILLLRFMFSERRYHKCEARVFAHNEASLALQHRLGFVEEGRLRDHVFLAGRHRDLVIVGIVAERFAQLHGMPEL